MNSLLKVEGHENGGGRQRAAGRRLLQVVSGCPEMEPAPPGPQGTVSRQREGHEQRAPRTGLPRARCPLGTETEVEARPRRQVRVGKVPAGGLLSLRLNCAGKTLETPFL